MKKIAMIASGAAALLLVSGCSVGSTAPDQIGLHYKAGQFESTKFNACLDPSTRDFNGPGDKYFLYPTSLRTYTASGDEGAERSAVTVVSKDSTEMNVPVTVTFRLVSDCDTVRQFHENIGNRNNAFWGGSDFTDDADQNKDGSPDGWVKVLNTFIGESMKAELDRASQGYTWRQLWNDPAVKTELEETLEASLSKSVDDRMSGHYFAIDTILVQKPVPVNPELVNAVANEQAAIAKANGIEREAAAKEKSAVAEANAEQAKAEAEVAVEAAEAEKVQQMINVLGEEVWLKMYGIDNGITPWPNPVVPGSNPSTQPAKPDSSTTP